MKKFDEDWLSSGLFDFEYKKYILLDYLQYIDRNYDKHRLYPFFSDLIKHYTKLEEYKMRKTSLSDSFPSHLLSIDWNNYRLKYHHEGDNDNFLQELDEIVEFGLESMKLKLDKGKEIYENIEYNLSFFPIGIEPLYKQEGFLLIGAKNTRNILAYKYGIRRIFYDNQNYAGLKTSLISSYTYSFANPLENIKMDLVHKFDFQNLSATYTAMYSSWLPLGATMLPIAKRKLARFIQQ